MIETKILDGFLDKLTEEALKEIEREGSLSQSNALPFLIKDQYTKINSIEKDFATKGDVQDLRQEMYGGFEKLDSRIDQLDAKYEKKFNTLYKIIGLGFIILGLLISLPKFN